MTHISLFTEAQATVGKLFAEQRESQNTKAMEEAELRNRRIAQEAERIARSLTSPNSSGFTPVSGDEFDSFYQAVVDILGPDVKIYKVIEQRDGGQRTRNYYASQRTLCQIEQHLKQHLRSYYVEHMQAFKAIPSTAPS